MKKISQILIKTTIALTMTFSVFSFAYAVSDYTPLVPLPGTTINNDQGATAKTNLGTYVSGIFYLSIGIASVMAFVMITFGGVMYATSDSITGKSVGKGYIQDAVIGLLIAIGAYVILYTINPQILSFSIGLPTPTTTTDTTSSGAVSGTCTTCVTFTSLQLPTSGSANGKSIDPIFGAKLANLNSALNSDNVGWAITEGYPPSVAHDSLCHSTGTCIDAKPINPTASNINKMYADATSKGLSASYEVLNQAAKDSLVKSGVNASIISINPKATGQHFHIH